MLLCLKQESSKCKKTKQYGINPVKFTGFIPYCFVQGLSLGFIIPRQCKPRCEQNVNIIFFQKKFKYLNVKSEMDFTFWQLPKDEVEAIKFFQDKEIIHRERLCSRNHNMLFYYDKYKTVSPKWKCFKESCRETKGLRTQTWFFGSRIPLLTASRFIYCWCLELTSIQFCELQLEMNHNTVVDWNNYMREICANALMARDNVKIGGPGKTIELNVCRFKAKKSSSHQPVIGGMCHETKESFAAAV